MNSDDFIPTMLDIIRWADGDRAAAVRSIETDIPESWQAEAFAILDQMIEGTPFQAI